MHVHETPIVTEEGDKALVGQAGSSPLTSGSPDNSGKAYMGMWLLLTPRTAYACCLETDGSEADDTGVRLAGDVVPLTHPF